jgi:hypothetical protein
VTPPSSSATSRSCEWTDALPVNVGILQCLRESADRLDEVLDRPMGVINPDTYQMDWRAYRDLRVAAQVMATYVSAVVGPHRSALDQDPCDQAMASTEAASRYEPVTACGLCGKALAAGQKQWCSNAHRQAAYRRRHQTDQVVPAGLPPVRSRRAATVYECPSCEARFLGSQYCLDCHTFARRVGPGGSCPNCDEAVAVADLIEVMPVG